MNCFASNLKYLVKKMALSQASIESVVDKRQTTISNWMNGKTNPDAEDLIKLSNFFSIGIDDLCQTDLSKGNLISEGHFQKLRAEGNLKSNLIGNLKADFHQNIGDLGGMEEAGFWALLQAIRQVDQKLDSIRESLSNDTQKKPG